LGFQSQPRATGHSDINTQTLGWLNMKRFNLSHEPRVIPTYSTGMLMRQVMACFNLSHEPRVIPTDHVWSR